MEKLQLLANNLRRRGFEVEVYESVDFVSKRICEIVGKATVGLGSSMTLESLGIYDSLKSLATKVFYHLPGGAGDMERKALTSDYYLTSANAVSMDGHIVNIDGTGNRVSATCFGPQKVIYVVGKNKLAPSLEDALIRAKETAVRLAKHFDRKTPCVKTGKCEDCLSKECVCSITTIHRRKPNGINIAVFLINENLGL